MTMKNIKFKYKLLLLPALSCVVFIIVLAIVQVFNQKNSSNLSRIQIGRAHV